MKRSVENWFGAWRNAAFRNQFLVSIVALPVVVVIMRIYLDHVEMRSGVVVPDPLLTIFPGVDLNWVIFALLYSGILLGFVSLFFYPFSFLLTIRAFAVMALLRIVSLYLVPLDPAAGSIPLADPIVHVPALHFTGARSLFFCWETATMALLAMTARWRDMKIIFAIAALVISVLILFQRAQYSIDIVAAPCFAYAAFGVAKFITVRDIGKAITGKMGERAAPPP